MPQVSATISVLQLRQNASVEYRAKSAEGKVRHPVFKGIREDLQS